MTSVFGFESTADDVVASLDLTGRRMVVTGATGGLGLETARALACRGAQVWIGGRDEAKLDAALTHLRDAGVGANVEAFRVDLADLTDVHTAAAQLAERVERLDVLINNAGVMACPYATTAQGHELQFGTNHLGHFAFTMGLIDALTAADRARIINLASAGHRIAALDVDDVNFERRPYEKWTAYGAAKTANILFSVEADRRYRDAGVRSFAVHPGVIPTDLSRHLEPEDLAMFAKPKTESSTAESAPSGDAPKRRRTLKTIPQGAATSVYAATSPDLDELGGRYLSDCEVQDIDDGPSLNHGVRSYAVDPVVAERLWALSEDLIAR